MKQIYMHEIKYIPEEVKGTEGLQAMAVIYVSDKEEVDIFRASEMAIKMLEEGSKFEHRVLMTGYVMTGEEQK